MSSTSGTIQEEQRTWRDADVVARRVRLEASVHVAELVTMCDEMGSPAMLAARLKELAQARQRLLRLEKRVIEARAAGRQIAPTWRGLLDAQDALRAAYMGLAVSAVVSAAAIDYERVRIEIPGGLGDDERVEHAAESE